MNELINLPEQNDSIKLIKNSKGYTWEIKKYYDPGKVSQNVILKEIETLDKEMQDKFGKVE